VGLYILPVEDTRKRAEDAERARRTIEELLSRISQDRTSKLPGKALTNIYRTVEALLQEDAWDVDPEGLIRLILQEYELE
jgi:hypothetical protein